MPHLTATMTADHMPPNCATCGDLLYKVVCCPTCGEKGGYPREALQRSDVGISAWVEELEAALSHARKAWTGYVKDDTAPMKLLNRLQDAVDGLQVTLTEMRSRSSTVAISYDGEGEHQQQKEQSK